MSRLAASWGQDICGAFLRGKRSDTATKFQRGHDLAGLGVIQSTLFTQLGVSGARQSGETIELGENTHGDTDGVFAGDAGTQQNSDQFGIVQVTWAVLAQTFPGTFARRKVQYGWLVRNRSVGPA